jgi:hypothetical protein
MARALAVQDQPRKTKIASSLDEGFDSLEMDDYLLRKDDDEENYDSRMYVRDYARPSGGVPGYGGNEAGLSFWLPLNDLGDGVVDIRAYAGPHNGQQGTFTRATVATCRLASGLLKKVASGVPRSHYLASGEYGGYLAEGARTNRCLQSENFGTTWAATGTPTRSAAAASRGDLTLDLIGDDDAGALELYAQSVTFVGDGVKALSFFIKKGTATSSVIRLLDSTAVQDRGKIVITWTGDVPSLAVTTATLLDTESWGDGVYRVSVVTAAVTAANTNTIQVCPATDTSFVTTGTGTIYVGGMQAEDAAFASSYIPTTTASVTRDADVLTFPQAGNVSTTIGTVYVEGGRFAPTSSGDSTLICTHHQGSGGRLLVVGSGGAISSHDGTSYTATGTIDLYPQNGTIAKSASAWGGSRRAVAHNGVLATANPSVFDGEFTGTGAVIHVGGNGNPTSNNVNGVMKNVRLWLRQLPDAQLQSLTA